MVSEAFLFQAWKHITNESCTRNLQRASPQLLGGGQRQSECSMPNSTSKEKTIHVERYN